MIEPRSDGESSPDARPVQWKPMLGALGVVYGDIGTSPLYALREAARAASPSGHPDQAALMGILSLVFWALIVVVTLKYVCFLLRLDNKGEGGILSLMALAQKSTGRKFGIVFFMGLTGAALFYGDAAITPAISVLSAVEGLNLVSPAFSGMTLPLSVLVLLLLFRMQKSGTERISSLFGPVMVAWFAVMAATGIPHIAAQPQVLLAMDPRHAFSFVMDNAGIALACLGAVFLAVTGAEALYADLGHFGKRPVRNAWLFLVFPCLMLNYAGQAAFLIDHPEGLDNPFYRMAPGWALTPLIALATAATVIASQAVISGAFSLTRQAMQLGLLPRLEIRHTSLSHEGQIMIPRINTMLLLTVLFLCLVFRESGALASAYGIAVTGTMVVTTLLAGIAVRGCWKWPVAAILAFTAPLLAMEGVFLAANFGKIADGGFVPLLFAAALMLAMIVWVRGTRHLYRQAFHTTVLLSNLIETLDRHPPRIVDGTAIFLTGDPLRAPVALMQNIKHNRVLHRHNVVLTVVTTQAPRVGDAQRYIVERLSSGFTRVFLIFGYAETPDVPRALQIEGLRNEIGLDLRDASYFLGRRSIVHSAEHRLQQNLARAWQEGAAPARRRRGFGRRRDVACANFGLPAWQTHIYVAMMHSAAAATDFFCIPRNQVVEMGLQMGA